MHRVLKYLFYANIAFVISFAIFLLAFSNFQVRTYILYIREALFAHIIPTVEPFTTTPEQLVARGFLTDSGTLKSTWTTHLAEMDQASAKISTIAKIPSNIEKARSIVRSFLQDTRTEGCGSIDDLYTKIEEIQSGYGCCSDHTEVFLALASLVGLPAREMLMTEHGVIEFYSMQLHKWLFLDPLFMVMAQDAQGHYLSLAEIRQRFMRGDTIRFESIVPEPTGAPSVTTDPLFIKFYDEPADFARYGMTFGNNVFENDASTQRIRFLPKPIRHFVEHLSGIRPGYLLIADDMSREYIAGIRQTLLLVYVSVSFTLVSGLGYPLSCLLARVRQRRGFAMPEAIPGQPASAAEIACD
jgi:hypothetical protein